MSDDEVACLTHGVRFDDGWDADTLTDGLTAALGTNKSVDR